MSTYIRNSRTCDVVVFTAEELSAAHSNEQAVRKKIDDLQIKPGDTLLIREFSRSGRTKERYEFIGTLLSKEEDSSLVILTRGKKVWSNLKNKRSVSYRDIEDILVVNKA